MVNSKRPAVAPDDDWWDERLGAMEAILGPSDGLVSHTAVPFDFGFDAGSRAAVVHFRQHLPGVVLATCGLIGTDEQVTNVLGNYELAICHRSDEDWGIGLLGGLAYYTLDASLKPGSTMDIEGAVPAGSVISGQLFTEFARFVVRGRKAGLLLCIGITSDELALCRTGGRERVEAALKAADVYPFTDLYRASVLPQPHPAAARTRRGSERARRHTAS